MKEKLLKAINKLKRPLNICIIYLLLMATFASISRISSDVESLKFIILNIVIIIAFVVFIPYLLSFYKIKVLNQNESIISGLILFLLLSPSNSISNILIVCIIHLLIRCLIRYKGMPIFNPAAAALAITILINAVFHINLSISWWGTSFSPRFTDVGISIALIFTIPFGIYFLKKFNKQYIFITAFILCSSLFIGFNTLFEKNENILPTLYSYTFLEGTFLFALLVMLIEPKTTPNGKSDGVMYAIIFSFIWIICIANNINGEILWAIIGGNVFYFLTKRYPNVLKKQTPVQTTQSVQN